MRTKILTTLLMIICASGLKAQTELSNNIDASSIISGNSIKFEFGNEFVANPGFEIKLGSTVEIKSDQSLKCKQ